MRSQKDVLKVFKVLHVVKDWPMLLSCPKEKLSKVWLNILVEVRICDRPAAAMFSVSLSSGPFADLCV